MLITRKKLQFFLDYTLLGLKYQYSSLHKTKIFTIENIIITEQYGIAIKISWISTDNRKKNILASLKRELINLKVIRQ